LRDSQRIVDNLDSVKRKVDIISNVVGMVVYVVEMVNYRTLADRLATKAFFIKFASCLAFGDWATDAVWCAARAWRFEFAAFTTATFWCSCVVFQRAVANPRAVFIVTEYHF